MIDCQRRRTLRDMLWYSERQAVGRRDNTNAAQANMAAVRTKPGVAQRRNTPDSTRLFPARYRACFGNLCVGAVQCALRNLKYRATSTWAATIRSHRQRVSRPAPLPYDAFGSMCTYPAWHVLTMKSTASWNPNVLFYRRASWAAEGCLVKVSPLVASNHTQQCEYNVVRHPGMIRNASLANSHPNYVGLRTRHTATCSMVPNIRKATALWCTGRL